MWASNGPQCEAKGARRDRVALNLPAHAAGFCVDEKTVTQALGRLERHGCEYHRHGTLSLYAAFNTKISEVLGKAAPRHNGTEFVAFLADIGAH